MLEWATQQVIALIGILKDLDKDSRTHFREALTEFWEALVETELYTSKLDKAEPRDKQVELQLANKWGAVAIKFRDIDEGFAQTLRDKSRYWIDPDEWYGSPTRELNISLEMLHARYGAIFEKKK